LSACKNFLSHNFYKKSTCSVPFALLINKIKQHFTVMDGEYKGKKEEAFRNLGKKIDNFLEEFNEAKDRLEKDFSAKYEELKESADKLKDELENKDRWKEVEERLKAAGDEIGKAVKAAFKKSS
jgi:DNA-binding transcriptional regulator GbsR (MarR family)